MSLHPQKVIIVPPDSKYIPPNKFIDIDEKFYKPHKSEKVLEHEVYGKMGKPLVPYGDGVSYQPSTFVKREQLPLGKTLNPNYGSYIYDQLSGSDASHMPKFI